MARSEQEIFFEALTLSSLTARTQYLDGICGDNVSLRERLEELLRLHESENSLLDRNPQEMVESLVGGAGATDGMPHENMAMTLAALQPFLQTAGQPDSIGRIGHYELLQVLGQGGYGIVFKALDTKLSRLVAVKVMLPHLASTSPPRKRFLREARAAAAVRHENVVQIYAVEESPIPHLVMEFVSGETAQQRSDRLGPFEPEEVVRLGLQIARGLAAAHEQGLIHRDIKPCNILVEDGIAPRAKITDFGLARTADDANLSQSGAVIGTPMYMSPEQVRGEEVDQRTDLFSFGSVLYLFTAGRPPFRAPSTLAVLKRVAEDTPRPIRQVIPETPRGLCDVIARLHEKKKERRFSSAQDVADSLATCLQDRGSGPRQLVKNRAVATAALLLFVVTGVLLSNSLSRPRPDSTEIGNRNEMPATNGTQIEEPEGNDGVAESSPSSHPAAEAIPEPVELSNWEKAVALMSADDQMNVVRAKLIELNPETQASQIHFSVEDGVIRGFLAEPSQNLSDLSPLRSLRGLTAVRIKQGGGVTDLEPLRGLKLATFEAVGHPIRDLSPLKGMPLTIVGLWNWAGDDLTPLQGMQLQFGNFGASPLQNIEPLRGMPIEGLCLNHSKVSDLSPLEGMPLKALETQFNAVSDLRPIARAPLDRLWTQGSQVTDYSPIKDLPVTDLTLNYEPARDREFLRGIKSLKTLNGQPVEEILK